MREIKFRSWDIKPLEGKSKMIYGIDKIKEFYDGIVLIDELLNGVAPEVIIMQFTGLKDKNGKEIFEGDIVKASQWEYAKKHFKPIGKKSDNEGIFLIEIRAGHWGLETHWKHISGYECSTHIMGDKNESRNMIQIEVIGNIYENPELLEE